MISGIALKYTNPPKEKHVCKEKWHRWSMTGKMLIIVKLGLMYAGGFFVLVSPLCFVEISIIP